MPFITWYARNSRKYCLYSSSRKISWLPRINTLSPFKRAKVGKARLLMTTSPKWYTLSVGRTCSFQRRIISSSISSGVSQGRNLVTPSLRMNRHTPKCPKCVSLTKNTAGIIPLLYFASGMSSAMISVFFSTTNTSKCLLSSG